LFKEAEAKRVSDLENEKNNREKTLTEV